MKLLFAIRDVVAEALIGTIMVFRHDAAAVREFSEACANPDSLGRRAQDYELICLGTITEVGLVTAHDVPVVVLTGAAWKASQSPQLELAREA